MGQVLFFASGGRQGAPFRLADRAGAQTRGRLAISDIVFDQALPEEIAADAAAYAACISGAVSREEYLPRRGEAG